MTTGLLGAVKQLIVLLERYFTPLGEPPQAAQFFCPFAIASPGRPTDAEMESALRRAVFLVQESPRFASFVTDPPNPCAQEIMNTINPIASITQALRDTRDRLAQEGDRSARLRYLFDVLCAMEWTNHVGVSVVMKQGVVVGLELAFTLTPIGTDFISDLLHATEEADASRPPRIVQPDAEEQEILDLLRTVGHRLTTEQILTEFSGRGQLKAGSTTKAKLSSLVKKALLTNRQDVRPAGYGLPEW